MAVTRFWKMLCGKRDRRETTGVSERATRKLMSVRGVVSVGMAAAEDGAPVVLVGIKRSSAETMRVLPKEVEGLPVVVREVGEMEAREG